MVNIETFVKFLHDNGITFFTGVPDSYLNDFCTYLVNHIPSQQHILAANEGNAIAIAAGHYLATSEIPLVYMQNSGIGNATNPLLSLANHEVYGIPMLLVIGWRGEPSTIDHCQHIKQGELTPILMSDFDIPFQIIDNDELSYDNIRFLINKAKVDSSPVALIVKKGVLSDSIKHQHYPLSRLLTREEAISIVFDAFGKDTIYLASTGRATREVHEQRKIRELPLGCEFLNVGAMGHLSSIGLGIAMSNPRKRVVVFDGDASCIMHLGSLATIGKYQPNNFYHIILNNSANESVGGQPTPGHSINLTDIAKACGYTTPTKFIDNRDDFVEFINSLDSSVSPVFIDFYIRQGIRNDIPKLSINHQESKQAVIEYLKHYNND